MRAKAIRDKISKAMRGKSNFEGKSHDKQSRKKISDSRGHYDPIKNKKWVINKITRKTARKITVPVDSQRGRTIKTFREFYEEI